MLTTLEGQRAFEAGRLEQIAISRAVQRQSAVLWRVMRFADLDASAQTWAIAQLQAVLAGRQASSASARRRYNRLRLAEVGEALPAPPDAPPVTREVVQQVATSLRVTGPVRVKQAIAAGADPTTAMRTGATAVNRATQRLVLDGGRDTTLDLMQSDPLVTYYERVAAPTACNFCRMLADRGAVYTLESGSFRSHDGCGCGIRAVFTSEPRRRVNIGPPGHRNAVKATVYPNRADLPAPTP